MTNREKKAKRIAKRVIEDEALQARREDLEAVLDEFFNDTKYFEGIVEWMFDEVDPEERIESASKQIETEFRSRTKSFLRSIETTIYSALSDAVEEEKPPEIEDQHFSSGYEEGHK